MHQSFEEQTRIPGCQSTNHTECWGELWTCAACQKVICYQEGSDNDPDLCDDCWAAKHSNRNGSESSQPVAEQNDLYLELFVADVVHEFGQAGVVVVPICRKRKLADRWWQTIKRLLTIRVAVE